MRVGEGGVVVVAAPGAGLVRVFFVGRTFLGPTVCGVDDQEKADVVVLGR